MNESAQSLLRRVRIGAHGATRASSFAHFERAVQDRYWSHLRATVGTRLSERAVRLARRLWTYPGCFDPDDPCDNCSMLLSDTLARCYFLWWVDRHPEWQLDPFTQQDLYALGGCTSDAQLALWQ